MKVLWLLPFIAGHANALVPDRNFMHLCDDLSLTPDTGILSGACSWAGQAPVNTTVDLNGCLAWGPRRTPEASEYTDNHLFPIKEGHFSDFCKSCVLIKPGESSTQVGYIFCSCAPEGSDIRLEATYDLTRTVKVSIDGCLECLDARQTCSTGPTTAQGDDGGQSPLSLSVLESDWKFFRAMLDSVDSIPCEEMLNTTGKMNPRVLPTPHPNTGFEACPHDEGLCCFRPPRRTEKEAFKIVQAGEYFYRIHFATSQRGYKETDRRYTHVSMVYRICSNKRRFKCEEGETTPPYDLPGLNTTTKKSSRKTSSKTGKTSKHSTRTRTTSAAPTLNAPPPDVFEIQDLLFQLSQPQVEETSTGSSKIITVTLPGHTPKTTTMTIPYFAEPSMPASTPRNIGPTLSTTILSTETKTVPQTSMTSPEAAGFPGALLPTSSALVSLVPNTTNPVVIDLDKLDITALINIMLVATNIDDIHEATVHLKVKAACTSNNGTRSCSDMVIVLAGAPPVKDASPKATPRPFLNSEETIVTLNNKTTKTKTTKSKTKTATTETTKTKATKTKATKTKTEKTKATKTKTTKTKSTKTNTRTEKLQPPTATPTLTGA